LLVTVLEALKDTRLPDWIALVELTLKALPVVKLLAVTFKAFAVV
jgi:hypothetical protein